ncbi:unnamed protein product (macronuclear) [Paramecium tetraurelia]|uniref:Transmembrane protein n=1 Tax=Paramecium tetraurelia TaxID=5888 RepID=A0CBF9_PARTE|nr:uncharacterized protein GSPATT00036909001 [Paramecium tetraurelia]CAK68126.1 unnamed protein product [Paramecium tetraurelia]|eukprot:XP_001435523.1 hypothetical protein (macronuclear) [Paramecium tetraurelia strain d4-2]
MIILILVAFLNICNGQLKCKDSHNLTVQMELTILIPNYDCILNTTEEALVNMTSQNASLVITGEKLQLNENVHFEGFSAVQFLELEVNTNTHSLISDSPILLKKVTLLKHCRFLATHIKIENSTITQNVFRNRQMFSSPVVINGLFIKDSSLFQSSITNHYLELQNLFLESVHIINSTLGSVDCINQIAIQNSFIASSEFLNCNIIQEFQLYNTFIILSTLIRASGSVHISIRNVSLSKATLFILDNENQVQMKNINFSEITSDTSLITVNSPYLNITNMMNYQLKVQSIFQISSTDMFVKNITCQKLDGSILLSNQSQDLTLLINQFNLIESTSKRLFDMSGSFQIRTGIFKQNNCSLINSLIIHEVWIDSMIFQDLNNQLILSVSDSNTLHLTNLTITSCEQIMFAKFNTVISVSLQNIKLSNCKECNFLVLNQTNTFIKDITILDVQNFFSTLIFSWNTNIVLKRLNLRNIYSNAQQIVTLFESEVIELSNLIVNNVDCQYCQGIIKISNFHSAQILKSSFSNLSTSQGTLNIENTTNFTAINNQFINITAIDGSSFYIFNSSIKILQNEFINLAAKSKGGAVYHIQAYNTTYYIENNSVSNVTSTKGQLTYLVTESITAQVTDFYIDGPVFFEIFNQTYSLNSLIRKQVFLSFQNFKSGKEIKFNISILDSDKNKLCKFQENIYLNNYSYHFDQYRCNYEITYLYYQQEPQDEQLVIIILLEQLKLYNNNPFSLQVLLNFTQCEIGEQWIRNSCQKCIYGTYSFDTQAPCIQCLPQAQSCLGGAEIDIKPGYWRPHNLTASIERCKPQLSVCLGGKNNFTCGEGYLGAICQDCDYYSIRWEKSYARSLSNYCAECQFNLIDQIKPILAFLWISSVLYFSVCGALKMARAQLVGRYLRLIGLHFGTRSSMTIDQTEVLLKMISTYFQLLSILLVLNIKIPQPFQFLSQIIGNPLQTFGFQIECLLIKMQFQIEIVYLKQIWNLITSIIFVSLFIFTYFIQSLCKHLENSIQTMFINSLIQVLFYFQGDLIEGLFEILFCIKASGQYYIQASTQYICYTPEHQIYIRAYIIPVLLTIGLFKPLFYFIKLNRNKSKLWTCQIRLPYGYLFIEYKNQYYYWEFVRFIVKSLFYILSTLLIQDFKLLFLFVILVLLCYLELLNRTQPYLEYKFNVLDKVSTQLEIVSLILAYIQDDNNNQYIVDITNILISIINLIFILYFIYKILIELSLEYKKKIQEKLIALIERYPWLGKCIKKPVPSTMPARINYLWKKARMHVYNFISQIGSTSDTKSQSSTVYRSLDVSQPKLLFTLKPQLMKYLQCPHSHLPNQGQQLEISQQSSQNVSVNQSQILEKPSQITDQSLIQHKQEQNNKDEESSQLQRQASNKNIKKTTSVLIQPKLKVKVIKKQRI